MTLMAVVLAWLPLSAAAAFGAALLCRAGHDEDVRLGFVADEDVLLRG